MAYFGTDDATSSDDFLARLEAKINSIGITKTPSPTHQEEEEQEEEQRGTKNERKQHRSGRDEGRGLRTRDNPPPKK